MSEPINDFLVIGGGLVGLATALEISERFPDSSLTLIEKENAVCMHQSGRNSGVLHSGIYYKPGSLKAVTCRLGKRKMEQFCQAEGVRFELCGKVIVAVDESELEQLEKILERGKANGVTCRVIDATELKEIEPHAAGVKAIHVPETGIVDYPGVARKIAEKLVARGKKVVLGQRVQAIREEKSGLVVMTPTSRFIARQVVNCAGLYSDEVIRMAGGKPPARIVPFRGEYYQLKPDAQQLCRNLIYPVPDPNFPFLGVHLTRMVDGSVECGPNAVLALAREGYSWGKVRVGELFGSLSYGGFLKMATKHWKMGMGEIHRSLSKQAFATALQRLVPELKANQLVPCRAGVRAQAVGADGALVDDFLIQMQGRITHVCNAPSPAATASLQIGAEIVDRMAATM